MCIALISFQVLTGVMVSCALISFHVLTCVVCVYVCMPIPVRPPPSAAAAPLPAQNARASDPSTRAFAARQCRWAARARQTQRPESVRAQKHRSGVPMDGWMEVKRYRWREKSWVCAENDIGWTPPHIFVCLQFFFAGRK